MYSIFVMFLDVYIMHSLKSVWDVPLEVWMCLVSFSQSNLLLAILKSENDFDELKRFGTVLAKIILYLWNCMGPLTWRKSNKPPFHGDCLAFHTCGAAWRVLTRPIKVYSSAPWSSFNLMDSPTPVPDARAGEGYTLSGVWRRDGGMGGVGWG